MKWLSCIKLVIICGVITLFAGCAANSSVDNYLDEDFSGIVNLHKEMNEKHGKTSSYFASIAIADGDYDKGYGLYYKECKEGSVIACLNAYYVGEERSLAMYDSSAVARDLDKSVRQSIAACQNNESLGCVNVFFAFDTLNDDNTFISNITSAVLEGRNNDAYVDKALNMTKKECQQGDATSCFYHARMLRSMDEYTNVDSLIETGLDLGYVLAPFVRLPMQSPQTIDYFKRACALDEAISCRYMGYWFDAYEGDKAKSREYYKKSCKLGLSSACDDEKATNKVKTDEVGAPVLNRR